MNNVRSLFWTPVFSICSFSHSFSCFCPFLKNYNVYTAFSLFLYYTPSPTRIAWCLEENEWRNVSKQPKILFSSFFSFVFFFLFLFHFVPHLHTPISSFHTEPSISLSWCPSWWLWEWLCWWRLLLRETTHKHFVTQFRVFVHWTVLGSLPHVVWAMITVLPSLLHPVQPGHVLFMA